MALHLLHGPPNSGRRGIVRERFEAALGRDPVLAVPTVDDVFSFEQEICAKHGALLGGSVVTFGGLFGEVAKAAGEASPKPLSDAQRIRLCARAAAGAQLGPLRDSAARPGFAAALDELIRELQGANLDPAAVAAGASTLEGSAYLTDLTELYRSYTELRDSGGHADSHTLARAAIGALKGPTDVWGGRPVLLYGFDDLTVQQFELVTALASCADVTVAVTYEDRAALAARARLFEQLKDLGPHAETRTEPDPGNTRSDLLFRLERGFLAGLEPMEPDTGLTLLRAAGVRGEAELIGGEIARLLADGAQPDQIAVALRDPVRRGALYAGVLRRFGIPVALEANLPVAGTGTGGCLLALLRAAFTSRSAADLLAYLRGPRRAGPGQVDWLERSVRRGRLRSAEEAAAAWEKQTGEAPRDLGRLRVAAGDAAHLLREVASLARDISQWPLARAETRGTIPEHHDAAELRAGEAIAAAVDELADLGGPDPSPEELISTLEALTMQSWSGPVEGRVRIASPYRLRASRFDNVFVASLQDGEFPRHGSDGPFLSDEQRAALGLPERQETEAEERYLFHACLALPTERLYLSWRSSDEAGGAEPRSPFLGEVRRLLDPPPPDDPSEQDRVEERLTRARGLGNVLFAPADAPSELELARSLAVRGDGAAAEAALGELGVGEPTAGRVRGWLAAATETEEATREPGPLQVRAVRRALAEVSVYGGTTLELFDVCSYRWFVDHELAPEPLDPTPEALTQGTLMHEALERLYGERPGGDPLPRPGSLDGWIARGREIVDELAAALSDHPSDRAMRRRVERLLIAFLRREAAREAPRLIPEKLEAVFGEGDGADRPPLKVGDWSLHGRIDRVDEGAGVGLVLDYKLSREVTPVGKFVEAGTLQLPLYLMALRELWQLDPVGGLYQPLRPTSKAAPRGLVRSEDGAELLSDLGLVGTDLLSSDEFEDALEEAAARATAAVQRMRAGEITRDPGPPLGYSGHNQCPEWCTFAPICRRERSPLLEQATDEEEEQG
ncbi:MAG: PD-(D/E)XK nuclease family protein [Actinomycetota bacterium]